jgi:hypothetical protein
VWTAKTVSACPAGTTCTTNACQLSAPSPHPQARRIRT